MLINERQDYKIKYTEAQRNIPHYNKKAIFRDLYTKVSPHTLKKIMPQYKKMINHTMKPCTKYFTTTIKLPYAHIIKR